MFESRCSQGAPSPFWQAFHRCAPRSQYWPLAEPISGTPIPVAVSQATALPMTPPIIPKHVTLKDFANEKVKVEPPSHVDSADSSFDLVTEVIDVSSESDADSSSTEEAACSSSEDPQIADVERPSKIFPDASEQWFQHVKTKTIHAADDVDVDVKVSRCGRRMGPCHRSVQSIVDWTAKCRVCFLGRRQC